MKYLYDLHIHSALSPCADNSMTPVSIVATASAIGLEIIAVTDHNCARNVRSAVEVGEALDVLVVPGAEIQTNEDVHVVCYFPDCDSLDAFMAAIPFTELLNDAEVFGEQLVVNSDGKSIDEAINDDGLDPATCVQTSNETGTVITDVSNTPNALGYISLGSVAANTDKIKAVNVEGVEPTVANIEAGTYKLSRPFNFVYKTETGLSDLAQNFIDFIESADGQELVNKDYIGQAETEKEYTPYAGEEKTLTLTGSTSVQPLMIDFIIPAYQKLNPGITIECSGTGSGQGETDAAGGLNDLGMISRALGSDYEGTLTAYTIALDGIAVIVHKDVNLSNVTFDQLYNLYMNGTAIPCDAE